MSTTAKTDSVPEPLRDALATWRRQVEAELKGVPFEKKLLTRTPEGITLRPLYTRADVATVPHLATAPGQAPYLRGFRPGDASRRWECCQEVAATNAEAFNRTIRADLMAGQDSVALTPDLATRSGADADEAPAALVGAGGLSILDGNDLEVALRGIDLAAIPLHVSAGAEPLALAALVLGEARARGLGWNQLHGSVTADPIAHWLETGHLPADWPALQDQLAGWTRWAAAQAPRLRTIGVDASLWHEAGGTATHELAYALAAAVDYVRALVARGMTVAEILPRVRFTFAAGPQFFTEIAKFRAWRVLWTKVVVGLGAAPELAATSAVHARTGHWNHSLLDPQVNLLRVTTAALSAVLGGVDSLHVSPADEITGKSDDTSRRIARNLHTLLAEEFHTLVPADPAGGSWYLELLTDELARRAWTLFQEVEAKGGLTAALAAGVPQAAVAAAAKDRAAGLATRRNGLIGVNLYPNLRDKLPAADTAADSFRSERARAARERRGAASGGTWQARSWPDCLPAAVAAARDGATVGQLARLARSGQGAPAPIAPLPMIRGAAAFEALRARAAALPARPKVFLAKMGPVVQHKARADFASGFFSVGGFEPLAKQTFATADEAAAAAVASGAKVAVLCSTDETYPDLAPAFARAVKAAGADLCVVLAGLPADPATVDAFRTAGVDEFIHVRANLPDLLGKLLTRLETLS